MNPARTDPPCQRFEAEGLEAIERGEPLDPHFTHCIDCAHARIEYEELTAALGRVAKDARAPAGWQAGVWRRIDRPKRPWRLWVAAPALAAVAAVVAVAVWPPGDAVPGITVERIAADGTSRGAAAQPGDLIRLRAEPGESPFAELRVYRAGTLVLRCGDGASCRREGGEIVAEVRADALGKYQTLLLVSDQPIAPPAPMEGPAISAMNRDLAAALGAGARAIEGPPIDVY